MCGLVGAVSLSGEALNVSRLKPMADLIAHRGPDDAGYLIWNWSTQGAERGRADCGQAFVDPAFLGRNPLLPVLTEAVANGAATAGNCRLMMGHRRLAVIDLSPLAHQPMGDPDGRRWVVYNGEIYNFRELRSELERLGHRFSSASDTEVVLHAYIQWGENCFARFNGMFALALWDGVNRKLVFARDRYGIKPLYFMDQAGVLLFSSEIKPLLAYRSRRADVDLLALNEYMSFQNIFSDRTLFSGVRLMRPGHYAVVSPETGTMRYSPYWDFEFSSDIASDKADVRDQLVDCVSRAVVRQCVSDVPVGSYLSGGIDSGAITALTARQLGRITTFTAGFDLSEAVGHELNFDEREQAERMACLLQTEHFECVLHSGDMEAIMDWLIYHLEDLRIGQSYPNALVARLASKFVKVVMSGAGGDELFGGYPWRYAAAVGANSRQFVENYYNYWQRLVPDSDKQELYSDDVASNLGNLVGYGKDALRQHTFEVFRGVFPGDVQADSVEEQINHSLYFECKTFLHGLLLVEDRLSMGCGLETRVPFLDNDLVDFSCRIPASMKLADISNLRTIDENIPRKKKHFAADSGKRILRDAMARILPPEVAGRHKQGFSAPDESWFRGSSEAFVRLKILNHKARIHEYFNRDYIEMITQEHFSGVTNHRLLIWSLLSIESWLTQFA